MGEAKREHLFRKALNLITSFEYLRITAFQNSDSSGIVKYSVPVISLLPADIFSHVPDKIDQ